MKYCGVCGHGVRDWAAHVTGREHQRKLHPVTRHRKSTSYRARRRRADRTLSKSWEDRMWDDAERLYREDVREAARRTGRHYYGRWVPWGKAAYEGGHPAPAGAGGKRKRRKRRRG